MTKRYDRAYFDRWYREPGKRIWARADVERKARMVLGIAEFLLDRQVRSVLDVGCGEGSWQPILKQLRPRASYLGVEPSAYAVSRYGRRRNIVQGSVGSLGEMDLGGPFDLVVCCDVLHYVKTPEMRRGLEAISLLARGPAYLEVYALGDGIEGDRGDFQRRSPATIRRLFASAGFVRTGPHFWVGPVMRGQLVAMERS